MEKNTVVKHIEDKKMNIEGGFVDISDPCYAKKVWCRRNNVGVKAGKYCCVEYVEGITNNAIAIIHEDYVEECINSDDKWFFAETCISVDSARAGFFIDYNGEYADEETGVFEDAFFEATAYGDGTYPVYYYMNREFEIVAIKILFDTEDEEEEE